MAELALRWGEEEQNRRRVLIWPSVATLEPKALEKVRPPLCMPDNLSTVGTVTYKAACAPIGNSLGFVPPLSNDVVASLPPSPRTPDSSQK